MLPLGVIEGSSFSMREEDVIVRVSKDEDSEDSFNMRRSLSFFERNLFSFYALARTEEDAFKESIRLRTAGLCLKIDEGDFHGSIREDWEDPPFYFLDLSRVIDLGYETTRNLKGIEKKVEDSLDEFNSFNQRNLIWYTRGIDKDSLCFWESVTSFKNLESDLLTCSIKFK